MLELAGLPIHENMDGVSLLPLTNDPTTDVREQMAFMNVYGLEATRSLSVLTKDWKYNYWSYGDSEMQPAEELFDLVNDPQEIVNAAIDSNAAAELNSMRTRYDAEVEKWKTQAVTYNDYRRYGTLFDRTIPLNQKEHLLKGTKKPKKKKSSAVKP